MRCDREITNVSRSEFVYDGFGRRRIRKEYRWQSGAWLLTNEVRHVYHGMRVIQERNAQNLPLVTYTLGLDLSGSLEGAGGIGGLLARTENSTLITRPQFVHAYYHADGVGSVTALTDGGQRVVARYNHDPFGNMLSMSGPMAQANLYRFSSKE